MLKIDQTQLDSLETDRRRAFACELAERARGRNPKECAEFDDDALTDAMEAEIVAARAAGLRRRSELERFTDLAAVLGFGFSAAEDWARAAFADEALKPEERLSQAEETAVFVVMERG